MNRNQFYHYIENSDSLNAQSLGHLRELVKEYPYFHAGRMMLVKNLHLLDDIKYEQELRYASVHIPDRRKMYMLIYEPAKKDETIADIRVISEEKEEISLSVESADESMKSYDPENYFNVTDEIDNDGLRINFSDKKYNEKKNEQALNIEDEDLFDYERITSGSSVYRLELDTFNPTGNYSFIEWLTAMKDGGKVKHTEEKQQIKGRNRQMELIESFLNMDKEAIAPTKETSGGAVNIAASSIEENDHLMTETLANIHIKQKHYEKAIAIFEKLSLKYPEKNIYFATRIEELEKLISNQ
ncbi:MAG: hypothetical protein JW717_03860 [Marinilabiliaceae bacterium]|nr:hypothetical protein [Marinilabiliaceae bacterium]